MEPVLNLLGLARRAGRLSLGEEPTAAAARSRDAKLIFTACDAAENTRRRAGRFGEVGACPVFTLPFTKEETGAAVGRGSCAVLAVTEIGFASALAEKLAAQKPEYEAAAKTLAELDARARQRRQEQRVHERRQKAALAGRGNTRRKK